MPRPKRYVDEHARPKNRTWRATAQLLDSIQIMALPFGAVASPTAGADDKWVTSQAMIYSVSWKGAARWPCKFMFSTLSPAIRLASRQACGEGEPLCRGISTYAPPQPRPRAD